MQGIIVALIVLWSLWIVLKQWAPRLSLNLQQQAASSLRFLGLIQLADGMQPTVLENCQTGCGSCRQGCGPVAPVSQLAENHADIQPVQWR